MVNPSPGLDGERLSKFGDLVRKWFRQAQRLFHMVVALVFLLNRKFGELAVFMLAAVLVGGFVMAPHEISGMVRDITEGKTDYTLIMDGPMFDRWAVHLTKGAKKYAKRNWMKANGDAEYERFKESALRHFIQWFRGERDEDHAAAVFFNINGAEYLEEKRKQKPE